MNHLGYYGKTVHRGDFVKYNLPKSFVTVWDDWLQNLLLFGEDKHGRDWGERYIEADTYRFVLSSGIAGESVWAGILLPGVDKVDRRFPFCLSATLPVGATPISAFSQLDGWYKMLETLSLEIVTADFEFDGLQRTLTTIATDTPINSFVSSTNINPSGPQGGNIVDELVSVRATTADALHTLQGTARILDSVLHSTLYQYSIWSTSNASIDDSTTYVCSGLPFGEQGIALFDRDWADSGCTTIEEYDSDNTNSEISSSDISKAPSSDVTEASINSSDLSIQSSTENIRSNKEESHENNLSPATIENSDVEPNEIPESTMPDNTEHGLTIKQADLEAISESEGLSTGDWSEFEALNEDESPVAVPVVEPLELDEESSSPPPWE